MVSHTLDEYRPVIVVSLLSLGLSLVLQFQLDSMFNAGDAAWLFRLELHRDYFPFSARTFTTYPALWLGRLLGGHYELSFAAVEFLLFVALGPVLYRYLRALGFNRRGSLAGLIIMYLSYPMVAAFHEPVCSWDDFWQYSAQLLAFTFLLKGKPLASTLAFTAGAAAREPSLILFPIWAVAFWQLASGSRLAKITQLLLPLVVAAGIWLAVDHEPAAKTIHGISENFRDENWTRNSLYSLYMGLGWLWLPAAVALLSGRVRKSIPPQAQFIRYGSLWGTLLVVTIVLWTAYARETRLFFPPFLFVIPLVMCLLREYSSSFEWLFSWSRLVLSCMLIAASLWAGVHVSWLLFPDFDYRSAEPFARLYLALHVAATITMLVPIAATGALRVFKRFVPAGTGRDYRKAI